MIFLRRLASFAAVALTLSLSSPLHAEDDNRFQIDLLVFANKDTSAAYAEQWPEKLYLRYPQNWARLHRGDNGDSFEILSEPDPEFAKAAASVRRSSLYRPLLQISWQQDLTSRKKAPAILVKGGKEFGNHHELEGYLKVAVERYLYVETNLWLANFRETPAVTFSGIDTEPAAPSRYYLPRQPVSYNVEPEFIDEEYESSPEYQEFLRQNPDQAKTAAQPETTLPGGPQQPIDRIVVMQQQRRMRSGELHFIDHPMFGIIVKITKLERVEENSEAPLSQTEAVGTP